MSTARVLCAFVALVLTVLPGAASAAASLDAEEAEAIVRAQWFEGVPDDRIGTLTTDAVARLGALLDDDGERAVHAPAIELLGRAGGVGAYEVVALYADRAPSGEVDGSVYRARLAIPIALGYLAQHDDRALARLVDGAGPGAAPSAWTHRHLDEGRIGVLRQKNAIMGLALSGRPEAGEALSTLASQSAPSAAAPGATGRYTDLRAHVDEARALHARRAAGVTR